MLKVDRIFPCSEGWSFRNHPKKVTKMSNSFKMKLNGQKVEVRIMGDDEKINSKTVHGFCAYHSDLDNDIEFVKKMKFHPSQCIGEYVGLHRNATDGKRIYLEVLSPFYKGYSDDSETDKDWT